ncbi:DNA/RNA non-specific endonuclease [Candidatus Nitrotoga sp. M5]|uniref:DNA/RNA non-specific endonuclease n=1 Tax=Candidatus Nitrotoga sp. M5 TaxID=2890409 RepID=UPI001EF4226C|nr:DNA/RNA non-specific endonuclease [Candidatus Nitrotoga sp. M5]
MFANNEIPVIPDQNLKPRALCYSEFAILHSGKSRTPIYVAQRLNKGIVEEKIPRSNRFFADARLPQSERATLEDYHQSGMDRGHMAPAANMATEESMDQSFSLANIVPQYSVNNRKSWAGIERATRKYIMRAKGDVFVISGPVFGPNPQTIGMNKVWIPNHLFKLVYDPITNRSWAHWLDNTNQARVGKPITYEELVRRTGIEFIPGLPISKHYLAHTEDIQSISTTHENNTIKHVDIYYDADRNAGPFGLKMGQKIDELNKLMDLKQNDTNSGWYHATTVPTPYPDFEEYVLSILPEEGLCNVAGMTGPLRTDDDKNIFLTKFSKLESMLTAKYGMPFIRLSNKEGGNLAEKIHAGDPLVTLWRVKDSESFSNISTVKIKAESISKNEIVINLVYGLGDGMKCKKLNLVSKSLLINLKKPSRSVADR